MHSSLHTCHLDLAGGCIARLSNLFRLRGTGFDLLVFRIVNRPSALHSHGLLLCVPCTLTCMFTGWRKWQSTPWPWRWRHPRLVSSGQPLPHPMDPLHWEPTSKLELRATPIQVKKGNRVKYFMSFMELLREHKKSQLTALIWSAGDHLVLRMSRQMRPSLSMFGW